MWDDTLAVVNGAAAWWGEGDEKINIGHETTELCPLCFLAWQRFDRRATDGEKINNPGRPTNPSPRKTRSRVMTAASDFSVQPRAQENSNSRKDLRRRSRNG